MIRAICCSRSFFSLLRSRNRGKKNCGAVLRISGSIAWATYTARWPGCLPNPVIFLYRLIAVFYGKKISRQIPIQLLDVRDRKCVANLGN